MTMTMTTTMKDLASKESDDQFGRKSRILLAACPGTGHIGPIISLANFLLLENLTVTLAVPIAVDADLPENLPSSADFRVIRIDVPGKQTTFIETFRHLRDQQTLIASDIIAKGNFAQCPPAAIAFDMMAGLWAKQLANALQLPQFVFFPSPLTTIYTFQHMEDIKAIRAQGENDAPLYLPGIRNPLAASDFLELPAEMVAIFDDFFTMYHSADGAIVHDLCSLYPRPQSLIDSINHHFEHRCEQLGVSRTQPYKLYVVGALCLFAQLPKQIDHLPEMQWLNQQRPNSVVFAALGSWLQITIADTIELARGLQLTGTKFLWAYRGHSSDNGFDAEREATEEVDDTGLPIGFRSEIDGQGIVLKWVNQQAILRHPAISCFVTHCGWNSTMEALAFAGVPLVLMPVGAEQGVNARVLEEDWRCGKKVWDMQRGRALERGHVAEVIRECVADEQLRETAQRMKRELNDAALPGGCVSETRRELCADLVRGRQHERSQRQQ